MIITIYHIVFKALTIKGFRNFATQILGYADGLKFYCKTSYRANNYYKLFWNDETDNKLTDNARRDRYVDGFVDHCSEKNM